MTSPEDVAYGINQVHLTVTLPSASADLGKPVRWSACCGRCGATVEDCQVVPAVEAAQYIAGWVRDHDRLYHAAQPPVDAQQVTVTAQASSWAGGWNEDAVDDSPPVDDDDQR